MFMCEFYLYKKGILIITTPFGERANACHQGQKSLIRKKYVNLVDFFMY